jgi:hypothetical protein
MKKVQPSMIVSFTSAADFIIEEALSSTSKGDFMYKEVSEISDLTEESYPDGVQMLKDGAKDLENYDKLMEYRDANNAEDFLSLKATLERNWRAGMGALTENPTKYSQYTLPGGENYREVLLTLPDDTKQMTYQEWVAGGMKGEWSTKGKSSSKPKYVSSHWEAPNVLAHIRINDRTDADGKRVMFVEEVQSDWGQDGKSRGFSRPEKTKAIKELEAEKQKTFRFHIIDIFSGI